MTRLHAVILGCIFLAYGYRAGGDESASDTSFVSATGGEAFPFTGGEEIFFLISAGALLLVLAVLLAVLHSMHRRVHRTLDEIEAALDDTGGDDA